MNTKILICGFGTVGRHIFMEFMNICGFTADIKIYDTADVATLENIKEHYDFAFICVPTDLSEDRKSLDLTNVYDVVSKVDSEIIVIKSTIPVGTTEKLIKKYNKNIIFSPEYKGETTHSLKNEKFLILGGDKKLCDMTANLYHKVKSADFKIYFTDSKTAELAKFMENAFLGLKVTFCSEFYDIAESFGISYNELRELFVLDPRMGNSHTYINPDEPFYDSHCLNKDIPAIGEQCERKGVFVPLLNALTKTNKLKKEKQELK